MAGLRGIVAAMALLSLISPTQAKEMPVNMKLKAELYDSGIRHMEIMSMKEVLALCLL